MCHLAEMSSGGITQGPHQGLFLPSPKLGWYFQHHIKQEQYWASHTEDSMLTIPGFRDELKINTVSRRKY